MRVKRFYLIIIMTLCWFNAVIFSFLFSYFHKKSPITELDNGSVVYEVNDAYVDIDTKIYSSNVQKDNSSELKKYAERFLTEVPDSLDTYTVNHLTSYDDNFDFKSKIETCTYRSKDKIELNFEKEADTYSLFVVMNIKNTSDSAVYPHIINFTNDIENVIGCKTESDLQIFKTDTNGKTIVFAYSLRDKELECNNDSLNLTIALRNEVFSVLYNEPEINMEEMKASGQLTDYIAQKLSSCDSTVSACQFSSIKFTDVKPGAGTEVEVGCNPFTKEINNKYVAYCTLNKNNQYNIEIYSNDVNYGKIIFPENSSVMFYNCGALTNLDLSDVDMLDVKDALGMFAKCRSLSNLDFSGINVLNVNNMFGTFYFCEGLSNLDLQKFDTSNVVNMTGLFTGCTSLESINFGDNFKTANVTDMGNMFASCAELSKLDLGCFDTLNVVNMEWMFADCTSLTELDLFNFNTSKVTNMQGMFGIDAEMGYVSSLTSINVSSFDTSKVTDMGYMFYGCGLLKNLQLSNFDTTNVTNMSGMFANCYELTQLGLSKFMTSNVTDMSGMFSGCSSLTSLDLSSFDISLVGSYYHFLSDCVALTTLLIPRANNKSDIELPIVMYDGRHLIHICR